jgi:hypothetical protein
MPLIRPRVVLPDEPRAGTEPVSAGRRDSMLSAILKWIPVEVIGTYKFVMGIIPSEYVSWQWGFTIFAAVIAPFWTAFATKPKQRRIAWRQTIIATVAFPCWVMAMQQDLMPTLFGSWKPWMGSVVLGAGTLLLPVLDSLLRKAGVTQN